MSRLTRRVRSDVPPRILKLLNLEEVPTECIEVVGTNSKTCDEVCEENQCSSCVLSAVFEKLAHYEDLEEQGRLIEQKHGRWVKGKDSNYYSNIYYCSNCLTYERVKTVMDTPAFDYCPNCGAKMGEVEK